MTELESLISMLPESIPGGKSISKIKSPTKSIKTSNSSSDIKTLDTLVGHAQAKKQQLTNKLSTVIKQAGNVSSIAGASRSNSNNISPSVSSSSLSGEGVIGNGPDKKVNHLETKNKENCRENGLDLDVNNDSKDLSWKPNNEPETVLVIPL